MERLHDMHVGDSIKNFLDLIAALIVAGVFMKVLTAIATLMSIAWYTIRFYEWIKGNKDNK